MDLQEVRWGGVDWIEMARDKDRWGAFVNAVMNLLIQLNVGSLWTSTLPVSF
jgi:hypothetical protein